jgi:hypothetical protein
VGSEEPARKMEKGRNIALISLENFTGLVEIIDLFLGVELCSIEEGL